MVSVSRTAPGRKITTSSPRGTPCLRISVIRYSKCPPIWGRAQFRDGPQLSAVASKTVTPAPAIVQALSAARRTLVHVSAGDYAGGERGREHTAVLLARAAEEGGPAPRWATHVNAAELDAVTGRALLARARHTPGRRRAPLTNEAEQRVHGLSDAHCRSALRHSAWLSRASPFRTTATWTKPYMLGDSHSNAFPTSPPPAVRPC